jgi:hypothetical protein
LVFLPLAIFWLILRVERYHSTQSTGVQNHHDRNRLQQRSLYNDLPTSANVLERASPGGIPRSRLLFHRFDLSAGQGSFRFRRAGAGVIFRAKYVGQSLGAVWIGQGHDPVAGPEPRLAM